MPTATFDATRVTSAWIVESARGWSNSRKPSVEMTPNSDAPSATAMCVRSPAGLVAGLAFDADEPAEQRRGEQPARRPRRRARTWSCPTPARSCRVNAAHRRKLDGARPGGVVERLAHLGRLDRSRPRHLHLADAHQLRDARLGQAAAGTAARRSGARAAAGTSSRRSTVSLASTASRPRSSMPRTARSSRSRRRCRCDGARAGSSGSSGRPRARRARPRRARRPGRRSRRPWVTGRGSGPGRSTATLTVCCRSLARRGTCTAQVVSRKWRRSSPVTVGTAKVANVAP